MSDDEIIEAIIDSENRVIVSKSDLPKSTVSNLDYEMPDEVIRLAELVPELGYEIEMKSWSFFDFELDYERNDNKYFNIDGRKLVSSTLKKMNGVIKKTNQSKIKEKKEDLASNLFILFLMKCQMDQQFLEITEKRYMSR